MSVRAQPTHDVITHENTRSVFLKIFGESFFACVHGCARFPWIFGNGMHRVGVCLVCERFRLFKLDSTPCKQPNVNLCALLFLS